MRRFVVIAMAALVAAGCGGGGGGKDRTADLTPHQILARSTAAASKVRFYHPTIALTVTLTTAPGAPPRLRTFAGTPLRVVADGPVRRPIVAAGPAFSFQVTAHVRGLTLRARLTKVASGIYLQLLGRNFKLPLPGDQAKAVRIPPEPSLFVQAATEVGHEDVDGVPTVHLRGTVDTDQVVGYLVDVFQGAPGLLGSRTPGAQQAAVLRSRIRAAVESSESDVWIGTQDLLPHRVGARLQLRRLKALVPALTGLILSVRADVGGFDEPATIVAPPNAQPFNSRVLRSLGF